MLTINRVSIGSAFKVFAILGALSWAIIGVIYLLFFFALASGVGTLQVYTTTGGTQNLNANDFIGGTSAVVILIYACGVPMYAMIGGITGAIGAFLFNLTVRIVGGLEIEVSGAISAEGDASPQKLMGKSVYIPEDDDPFSDATFRQ